MGKGLGRASSMSYLLIIFPLGLSVMGARAGAGLRAGLVTGLQVG